MKRILNLKIFSIVVLSLLLVFSVANASIIDKKSAIKSIKDIRKKSVSNSIAIKRIENDLKKSNFNFENFVQYAKLADTLKYHTAFILKISKETSKLNHQNALLINVLDIIKIPTMSISKFEEVMFMAINAKTEEEKQKVINVIEECVR